MAKKVITISVEEETLEELDRFAENLGLSRSAACNMIFNTVTKQDYKGFFSAVSGAVSPKNKARKKKGAETVTA